jgi:hypothetical protein
MATGIGRVYVQAIIHIEAVVSVLLGVEHADRSQAQKEYRYNFFHDAVLLMNRYLNDD